MVELRIASPCTAAWEQMAPVSGGRWCDRCERPVHDLTRATALEVRATAVVFGGSGLCARLRVDADGEAILRVPRPSPSRARPTLAAAVLGVGAAAAGCASAAPSDPQIAEATCVPTLTIAVVPPSAHQAPPAVAATPDGPAKGDAAADADADADGVPDRADACPTVDGRGQQDGCPTRVMVTTMGSMEIMHQVHFASGSDVITKESGPLVEATADVILAHPELVRIEIEGHADASERNPEKLSVARALAMYTALVRRGVDPARLVIVGQGSAKPIAPNATPADRQRNRRVELQIVNP
jgi:outer membrane protein OmpA-like peptidoglycan-associated protein